MSYVITALILMIGILSTLLAVKSGKLKNAKKELEKERAHNAVLTKEIVTINETIEKLKKIQAKKLYRQRFLQNGDMLSI